MTALEALNRARQAFGLAVRPPEWIGSAVAVCWDGGNWLARDWAGRRPSFAIVESRLSALGFPEWEVVSYAVLEAEAFAVHDRG